MVSERKSCSEMKLHSTCWREINKPQILQKVMISGSEKHDAVQEYTATAMWDVTGSDDRPLFLR
jgi:hypothetical protein